MEFITVLEAIVMGRQQASEITKFVWGSNGRGRQIILLQIEFWTIYEWQS